MDKLLLAEVTIRRLEYGTCIQKNRFVPLQDILVQFILLRSAVMGRLLLVGVLIRRSECGTCIQENCFVLYTKLGLLRLAAMDRFLLVVVGIRQSGYGN